MSRMIGHSGKSRPCKGHFCSVLVGACQRNVREIIPPFRSGCFVTLQLTRHLIGPRQTFRVRWLTAAWDAGDMRPENTVYGAEMPNRVTLH
ncbi:hypothetical protein BDQ94DRAFT_145804 [Aspergillus welwitschiae]|uniref:Uncharacterized protein n=1 Tax=Aspergillus welwitschiae TaxID=1341132 RepID=A0A3F3Q0W6_9EURO|nr:hypothetical protein BDQ94DRAFT_145804 [Aspergillus welwitschiae]RDH32286.1 hypothetical protein BDQ94DRAFT_145804 [Aspergillus welwitschiae]